MGKRRLSLRPTFLNDSWLQTDAWTHREAEARTGYGLPLVPLSIDSKRKYKVGFGYYRYTRSLTNFCGVSC